MTVLGLWAHNHDAPIASVAADTLRLKQTRQGLTYTMWPILSGIGRFALDSVRRGDTAGSSAGFVIDEEAWLEVEGLPHRIVAKATLREARLTPWPAYRTATAGINTIGRSGPVDVRRVLASRRADGSPKPTRVERMRLDLARRELLARRGGDDGDARRRDQRPRRARAAGRVPAADRVEAQPGHCTATRPKRRAVKEGVVAGGLTRLRFFEHGDDLVCESLQADRRQVRRRGRDRGGRVLRERAVHPR